VNKAPTGGEYRLRFAVALAFALISAVLARRTILNPGWPTDFDQLWHSAQALLNGENAYSVVGPGKRFYWDWPLYYPLPAVLLTTPFTFLPVAFARLAFSTTAATLLGWAMGPRIRTHWPMVLSASFIISVTRTQWTTLLLAAAWLPTLGFAIAAKPTVGLAPLASMRGRSLLIAAGGCAVLVLLSFLLQPNWVSAWLESTSDAPHIRPAVSILPAGPLLALAALRWKRADARLFLALVLVPHTPSLYDLLLLFFVCRTSRETLTLAVLTQVLFWSIAFNGESFTGFDSYAAALGHSAVFVVYLPVLIAILMRPNRNADPQEDHSSDQPGRVAVLTKWTDPILLTLLMIGGSLQILLPL
jgi:hypothetical protein